MRLNQLYEDVKTKYMQTRSKSQAQYEIASKLMPGGNTRTVNFHDPFLLSIENGEGSYIWDVDGHRYIDLVNNYTSMIHGHAHPKVIKSINEVMQKGTSYGALMSEQIELSKIIKSRMGSIEQIRYCNSGTEAALFGIRLARAYKQKPGILKVTGGYHGAYDDVEGVVGKIYRDSQFTMNKTLSLGIPNGVSQCVFQVPFNNLKETEKTLRKFHDQIAAIIVEPMLGAGGVIAPEKDYLSNLRDLADRFDVLLIFDEVQTLRLSVGGAQEKYGVEADITLLGKVIGGGFPIGAFGGKEEIMSLFDQAQRDEYLKQNGTYNGNRISLTAGIVTLEMLNQEQIDKMDLLSDKLQQGITEIINKYALPACVTRVGSILNFHFVKEIPNNFEDTKTTLESELNIVHLDLINHGIFTVPRGMMNLSTAITEEQINDTIQAYDDVLFKISKVL